MVNMLDLVQTVLKKKMDPVYLTQIDWELEQEHVLVPHNLLVSVVHHHLALVNVNQTLDNHSGPMCNG